MKDRHGSAYNVSIFYPGCGLHFKFILTNSKTGQKYLVKTTSRLVEWWQYVVFQWKEESGMYVEYPGRAFSEVASIINCYCANPDLYKVSFIRQVDIDNQEIWYEYHPSSRNADESLTEDVKLVQELWRLLGKHGFYYVDRSFDNVLIEGREAFLIDLESLIISKNRPF